MPGKITNVPEPRERESVSALERGFAVLHCFGPGEHALFHQQIAKQTGLPKATVSRITQTLVKLGYLDASNNDGRFRLTARALDLGHTYLSSVDIRQIAHPLMRDLARYANATVNLVVRSGDHMVVVETLRSENATVAIQSRIGFQFPILQTAIGRAYIAGLSPDRRSDAVQGLRLTVPAHAWKRTQQHVAQAVQEYDDRGFCALWGEWRAGVNSAATPIRDATRGELYVINCAGPSPQLSRTNLEREIGPRLVEIARQIEIITNVSWRQSNGRTTGIHQDTCRA